jgi:hypothetical protein
MASRTPDHRFRNLHKLPATIDVTNDRCNTVGQQATGFDLTAHFREVSDG